MTDTSKEAVEQALIELEGLVKCRCHEAYTGRGLHDPDCQCDYSEAVATLRALSARNRQLEMEGISSFCEAQAAYEAQVVLEAKLDEAVRALSDIENLLKRGVLCGDIAEAALAKIKAEKE